jgi:hypothetical protein
VLIYHSYLKSEQYGRACPCSTSSRQPKHGIFTSTCDLFQWFILSAERNKARKFSCPSYALYSKTVRGGILSSVSSTIRGKNPMHDCQYLFTLRFHFASDLILGHSYQRLYFRNANHPIARPSVITRREGRGNTLAQSRADDEGGRNDVDRRFVLYTTSWHDSNTLICCFKKIPHL